MFFCSSAVYPHTKQSEVLQMKKELFTNCADINRTVCTYCPFLNLCSTRIRTRCKDLVKCGCEIARISHNFHSVKREPATDSAYNFLRRNYALFMNAEQNYYNTLITPHSADVVQDGVNFRRALHSFYSAFSLFVVEPLHDIERMNTNNDTQGE